MDDLDKMVRNVHFINGDTSILVRTSNSLVCLTLLGDVIFKIPLVQHSLYVIGGYEKKTLCMYKDEWLQFYDLTNGTLQHRLTIQGVSLTDPRGYRGNVVCKFAVTLVWYFIHVCLVMYVKGTYQSYWSFTGKKTPLQSKFEKQFFFV